MDVEISGRSTRNVLLGLVAVLVLGIGAMVMLGSQVSGVLSTVGASIPSSGSQAGGGNGGGEGDGGSTGSSAGGGSGGSGGGDSGSGDEVPLLDVRRPELLIIKSGEITLQVDAISPALSLATQSIDRLGGYLSGSTRSGTGQDASASGTFRIPSDRWDDALVAMRGLGTVLDEQTETADVTGTVVDLEARVRNLRTTEAAFQAIMDDATVIKDVLTVQDELTAVRGEIERLQSEAAHLREKAAYSTLTVRLGLTPVPVIDRQEASFDPATEAEAATAHLVKVLQAVQKVGIWFGIVWVPILVALAVVGGVGYLTARWFRGRFRSGMPPLEPGEGAA